MNKFRIHVITILTGIMILIAPGCKKKDDVSNPTPTPHPLGNTVKIPGKLPGIMHKHEKASGLRLSAYKNFQVGKGLYHSRIFGGANGFGEFPYFDIVELGWDIYKESKGNSQQATEFNNIDNQLNAINNELTTLNNNLVQLAAAISLDFTKLQNFELAIQAQNIFNSISDLYSSTSNNGLMYFSQTAKAIKNGQSGTSWQDLDIFWAGFANNAQNNTSGAAASITALHGLLCPNSAELQDGLLAKFAVQVIIQSDGTAKRYGNVKVAQGLLENYFTTIINYQLQAMAVYGNVVNKIDTSGSTFKLYLNGTFRQQIVDEIGAYLKAVDFMSVNLVDFRNQKQFKSDMQYHAIAMAPDTTYLDGLARSRFIAALLQQAVNLNYSIISGAVITPNDLTNGTGIPTNNISVTIGQAAISANAISYESTYPYTRWGQNATSSADNNWNFYSIGDTALKFAGGETSVLINGADTYHPWRHEQPIQGTVKVMYYNPSKPDETTATSSPTDSNTMAFGFFSWNWYWGYMHHSMGNQADWNIPSQAYFASDPRTEPVPLNNPNGLGWSYTTNDWDLFPRGWGKTHADGPFMNRIETYGTAQISSTAPAYQFWDVQTISFYLNPPQGAGTQFAMNFFTQMDISLNYPATQGSYWNYNTYIGQYYGNSSCPQGGARNNPIYHTYPTDWPPSPKVNVFSDSINVSCLQGDQYTYYYGFETWANTVPDGYLDLRLTWCAQFCYTNTYNIFQTP